jgi:hypothetical protein
MRAAVRRLHDAGAAAGGDHVLARAVVLDLRPALLRADAGEFARRVVPAICIPLAHAGRAEDDHGCGDTPFAQVLLRLLVFELEAQAPRGVAQQEIHVHGGQAVGGGGHLGLVRNCHGKRNPDRKFI